MNHQVVRISDQLKSAENILKTKRTELLNRNKHDKINVDNNLLSQL